MPTTLLAVDDSLTMRKVLEVTFAGEDFKTVVAASGRQALDLLSREKPAVALVDHTLDDMNGYDLCQEIKSVAPSTRVVLLSSKHTPYDKTRAGAAGVDDFMDKPFDTQKLIEKVRAVMNAPAAMPARPAAAAAPKPPPPAVAPVRVGQVPASVVQTSARPRSQTLSYGTPAPAPAASARPVPPVQPTGGAQAGRTLTGSPTASPKPAEVAPKPAPAPAQARPAPATPPSPAAAAAPVVAAAVAASNGGLVGKLQGLGLSPDQVQAVLALSREIVEQVVWEVVPVLAETIIKEEIRRLTGE